LDKELNVVSANRSFFQLFRVTPEETVGKRVYDLGSRQWDIPGLRRLLEEIIPRNSQLDNYPVEHDFPFLGRRRILLNARCLYDELGSQRILLALEDLTQQPSVDKLFQVNQAGGQKNGG